MLSRVGDNAPVQQPGGNIRTEDIRRERRSRAKAGMLRRLASSKDGAPCLLLPALCARRGGGNPLDEARAAAIKTRAVTQHLAASIIYNLHSLQVERLRFNSFLLFVSRTVVYLC